MTLKPPITCLTNASKLGFWMESQENIKLEHNIMGDWHNKDTPPITQEKYDALSLDLRLEYSATKNEDGKLTREQWELYLKDRFLKQWNLIKINQGHYRELLLKGGKYSSMNLDNILK